MRIKGLFGLLLAACLVLSPVVRAAHDSDQIKARSNHSEANKTWRQKINLSELKQHAFAGDAEAQFALAKMYEEGKGGLPKSLAHALSWYEEAARNGLARAAKRIARLSSDAKKE
jgi:TPR repeat protein